MFGRGKLFFVKDREKKEQKEGTGKRPTVRRLRERGGEDEGTAAILESNLRVLERPPLALRYASQKTCSPQPG